MYQSEWTSSCSFWVKFRGSSYMWGHLICEYIRYPSWATAIYPTPCPCTSIPHGWSTAVTSMGSVKIFGNFRLNFLIFWIFSENWHHCHRLATLTSIPWTQERLQESQGQGHGSKVKGHRTEIPGTCTSLPLTGSPQAQFGLASI